MISAILYHRPQHQKLHENNNIKFEKRGIAKLDLYQNNGNEYFGDIRQINNYMYLRSENPGNSKRKASKTDVVWLGRISYTHSTYQYFIYRRYYL